MFLALVPALSSCAFMFPGLDYDNPFDLATVTEPGDKAEIVRSALLKRMPPQSTPIDEARQVLQQLGATCETATNERGGYLCVYKNLRTSAFLIISVVERVWYYTYRVHLTEAAGKLDDVSVEVERKTVDY
jgi:hypothetical protein